jgi:hypothetical protein
MLEEKSTHYCIQIHTKTREKHSQVASKLENLVMTHDEAFVYLENKEFGDTIAVPIDNIEIITQFGQTIIGFQETRSAGTTAEFRTNENY